MLTVPEGFTVRAVAIAGEVVAGTDYPWHVFPDGGATFATEDGGWIYVSNSEIDDVGGVGAIRFDAGGAIVDAYRILDGTSRNCAGGATPWGTWLSCEEVDDGQVWECDPYGNAEAVVRPGLGRFRHEAVAVDPQRQQLYLTEDNDPGRLWRFTPSSWDDLGRGTMEVAREAEDGSVTWVANPDDGTNYAGGEGIAAFDGRVVFTTKGDGRIRELEVASQRMRVLSEGFVAGPDNVAYTSAGDLFVCEDTSEEQDLVLIGPDGTASSFARITDEGATELAGVAFTPNGDRCYVSSQRGGDGAGITYEITGPFRIAPATVTTTLALEAPNPTLAPLPPDTDDDDFPIVVPVVLGAVAVAAGGLIWLRTRRNNGLERSRP